MIRVGGPRDAADLAELAAQTFHETFAADNRPEDLALYMASAYGKSQQLNELLDPSITTLLVEENEQLAGYAQIRSGAAPQCVKGDSPVELWRFYVAQPWQGQGLARTLMQRVISESRERGGSTLWLGVWERNERAKAFYRKTGFVEVGSHIFMVGTDAQTDRIMMMALPCVKSTYTRA